MTTLEQHAQAGLSALEERKFEEAIAAFESAVAMEPERPDMNYMLGLSHALRMDMVTAIPHLEKAVALSEPFTDENLQAMKRDYHLQLATAYIAADRVRDGERVLEGAIERWPQEGRPRLQLAQLYAASCRIEGALKHWTDALDVLPPEHREAAEALVGAVEAYQGTEHQANVFLKAHAESYIAYFTEIAQQNPEWYPEAERLARSVDSGELVSVLADGARPWALSRVDLVNPQNNEVHGVYSESETMVVALNGLEPLAQATLMFPWEGYAFEVFVCSQCPWHWLSLVVQFEESGDDADLMERLDERIGQWYLDGFNGTWGDPKGGRFHYASDPVFFGGRAVAYTFDMGRASYESIEALLNRLTILHDTHRISRVLFGGGRLPPESE